MAYVRNVFPLSIFTVMHAQIYVVEFFLSRDTFRGIFLDSNIAFPRDMRSISWEDFLWWKMHSWKILVHMPSHRVLREEYFLRDVLPQFPLIIRRGKTLKSFRSWEKSVFVSFFLVNLKTKELKNFLDSIKCEWVRAVNK